MPLERITKDGNDSPYKKLLEQIAREDGFDGRLLVTTRQEGKAVTIEVHKGAASKELEKHVEALGGIFSVGFELAYKKYQEMKNQTGGGKMTKHTHHVHAVDGRAVAVTVVKGGRRWN